MNRGDIWLIELGGKAGKRPAVILARQNVLEYLNKVSVAEVTTKSKGYPTEVFVGQKANLPKPSFVQADNIHTVGKHRMVKYLGTLDPDTMREISKKVVLALELENCLQ
ncbi:MAG: type II toxin-antitoxin system PemK/MazF family toxin [Deltaproteobacteria bacterium]|nr:type II toxin-antitoxin system PemK/MazF family toxin [Deltaproteobacteria bacterium]MBW1924382.1 type II toxin-antitoxin system PemK/MazF family toxin [Deltaproteobacteria bacterium]MBW1949372.1 type II toxin-antitoxin system PemK/MazF family toxin [Deltaproteobacteria bacterium]MBW2007693.1 type II toxin-antitoxin system PemK/MazF family toxin [Deltaproteobacteria bacterium]